MRERYSHKKQPMAKVLAAGLVILGFSLGVCFWFVSILEKTYGEEMAWEFQDRHIIAGEMLDNTIKDVTEVVEATARAMGNENYECNNARIVNVLRGYEDFEKLSTLSYITEDGWIYYLGLRYSMESAGPQWEGLWEELHSHEGNYVGISQSEYEDGAKHILIAVPVMYGESRIGYVVGTMSLYEVFDGMAFNYLNQMGECYLTDYQGDILSRSTDAVIIEKGHTDFKMSILSHMNGGEENESAMQQMMEQFTKAGSGFITLTTQSNESMQISYYTMQSVEDVAFLSCYNDNLIDDKIQPLIFRSVASCILIITLMVAIIVYVWATAKKSNLTIEKLAYEDSVTKGKNINYFKEFAMATLGFYKETPFVIYRFDIANFRYINEAYGHTKADEVLASCIRNFDEIFSDKELCVRMNADQFLAIIENDNTVDTRLKQYKAKVNEDARSRGIKYPIRFKTGIYQVKKHEKDIDIMIDHANVARKTLAGDEKEMVAVYSEQIVTDMRKVDRIESDMQRALATGEFRVYLQPKWDIFQNRIAGAEALVRWIKNDGSIVLPGEFIPVFENNGFIEKLDFYMLEMACRHIRELLDEGRPIYPVSVNQSRVLLHNPDYVATIKKIISSYKIPENYIELEITESVFLDERDKMIETMKQLKNCGVTLAMDDFGSGYSSLNMLKDVPFDVIKIDRGFFSESVTSQKSLVVLHKIMEMAEGLGISVVCEGVESVEQIKLLQAMGCRVVQGFYYSKPIPREVYEETYCR